MSLPKLLLVDDEMIYLKVVEFHLKNQFDLLYAPNGVEAEKIALAEQPKIILTDWEMPRMNGIELIEKLQENPDSKDIPVIMCTGAMTDMESLKTALDAGAVDFIRKPIEPLELISRVNSSLRLANSYHKIKEQKNNLEEQAEQLKHFQKNVTASLEYARNIQAAVFPSEKLIATHIPDFFMLNCPRDIVSGDFCWFAEKKEHGLDKLILAVSDCTGHGVPGAFMSLIGDSLLNSIVHDREIHRPDLILNELHKGVQSTLNQYENANTDGMDITLCTIDKARQKLYFAGAKNRLHVVKNGEVSEIRGDKHSIGGTFGRGRHTFSFHEFDLTEPAHYYLFTDGLPDQIGGEQGKKLLRKRIRQMLLDIQQLPFPQQKKEIERTLYAWKGDLEQVDDIMTVGFSNVIGLG